MDDARGQNSRHNIVRGTSTDQSDLVTLQDKHRLIQEARSRLPHAIHPKTMLHPKHQKLLQDKIETWFYLPVGATSEEGHLVDDDEVVPVKEPPLTCPNKATLARFKKASLDYLKEMAGLVKMHSLRREQKGMQVGTSTATKTTTTTNRQHGENGFFRSAASRDNLLLSRDYHKDEEEHDLAHIQRAHDAEFDSYVAKKKFCQLDVDRLMEDETFVEFVFVATSKENGWGGALPMYAPTSNPSDKRFEEGKKRKRKRKGKEMKPKEVYKERR
eukprot:CAMPEP_0168197484 /NCGR_PEP_ID=MMETSP0139_2-20121125/21190_1 /TAXON_ID=44445 /ORGANISM="Pseudo-nitzschia australis, Strain 10249 10 AB" /LENGTH=271 /DNA_ID=CAMNT_0008121961 /DNA_START=1 /DNA_END=816 /DNA_ORIENTATION=-